MKCRSIGVAVLACTACAAAARANSLYQKAGWVAFLPTGSHQTTALATIVDAQTILIEHLTYDGTAPAVYFYLGATDTYNDYLNGLEVPPLLDRAYADETMVLTLPAGETLDDYNGISLWCAAVLVNFTSASFVPPAQPYPRAGWIADMPLGIHYTKGVATIISERVIRVEHFAYDFTAPGDVYLYLGEWDDRTKFMDGLRASPLIDHSSIDETVIFGLPGASTLDGYGAISVWCETFEANFTSAMFRPEVTYDADNDDDCDTDDYSIFADCMMGPRVLPMPVGADLQICLGAFDLDDEEDVDMADTSRLQRYFTGPLP